MLNALREAIERADESQYSISKGADVNRSQLSRLLSGERGLSIDSAERIAEYLGLEIILRPKARKRKGRRA